MYRFFSLLCMGLLMACASNAVTPQQQRALAQAISTPQLHFETEWVTPLGNDATQLLNTLQPAGNVVNGNRIYATNGFLIIRNDSIIANLPYFGRRQVSGGNPGNTGIKIEDKLSDWTVLENKKDEKETIRIRAEENSESYTLFLTMYASGTANISLNSSQRQSLSYQGTWK